MKKAVARVRGEAQKNIVKLLEGLSNRYSKWEVWQDFIIMSAIGISNVLGGPYKEEREKQYMSRARNTPAKRWKHSRRCSRKSHWSWRRLAATVSHTLKVIKTEEENDHDRAAG